MTEFHIDLFYLSVIIDCTMLISCATNHAHRDHDDIHTTPTLYETDRIRGAPIM